MGVHVCEGDDATFLYCSTSMRPVNTPAFTCSDDADSFLSFATRRGVRDVRALKDDGLDALHTEWLALPRCQQCGERVVQPGELPNECEGCRPPCDWASPGEQGGTERCNQRGEERVRDQRTGHHTHSLDRYCPHHADEIRKARAAEAQAELV